MPVRFSLPDRIPRETPDVVIDIGWRDIPLTGIDACAACKGWGCRTTELKGQAGRRRQFFRTCPSCQGRGWVRPA